MLPRTECGHHSFGLTPPRPAQLLAWAVRLRREAGWSRMARLGLPLRIRSFECSAPRGTRRLGRLHRHRRSRSCRRACPSGLRVRRGAGLAHDPREHGHAGPSPGARREARKDRDLLSGEGGIRTLGTLWVHTLSRRAPSAARAPLRRANRRKCRREVQGDGARCGSSSADEAHSVVAGRGGMDGTPPSPRPPGRRRRPRRRHGGGNHPSAPRPPTAVVPEVSRLAATPSGSDRLDAAEVAEMKEHLAFLRRHKDLLRLKLNAAEDLLVNGQREPSERGVCHHLLAKVDRGVIEAAVQREPLRSDPSARARMLAGAIRLTADPSVLLTYLETLPQVRSHTEAAQAFGEVVARLDFESVSASRLGRLLQVLIETFTGHERVQVLFSLLAGVAFARAFDAALPSLAPAVVEAFAPLRAVHRRAAAGVGGDQESAAWLPGRI